MVSLYNCWTCDRSLLDLKEITEEYFFWCNRECYDKDDRYHNREKIVDTKSEVAVIDRKTEKEQRSYFSSTKTTTARIQHAALLFLLNQQQNRKNEKK